MHYMNAKGELVTEMYWDGKVQVSTHAKRPPVVHLDLTAESLQIAGALGDTIFTVDVLRQDGKTARFHLRLVMPDSKPGKIFATVSAVKKTATLSRELQGAFISLERP